MTFLISVRLLLILKVCKSSLFDNELLQFVFVGLCSAREAVSKCMRSGGNELYCKPQIDEKRGNGLKLLFSHKYSAQTLLY